MSTIGTQTIDVAAAGATGAPRPAPPRRPGPRPWWAWGLAVVSVIGVLALVVGAVGATVSALSQRSASGVLGAAEIDTVRITAGSADVTIAGDVTSRQVTGEWSTSSALENAGVTSTVRDGVMTIDLDCPQRRWFGPDCETRLTLTVPAETQLSLDMETATVFGSGLVGDIDVSVNAGWMELTGLSSQSVRTSNNAGGIVLRFDTPPRTVIASTNVGTVTVQVPDDGTRYAVTTSNNVGDESSDVPNDVDSTRFINASTNVGTVNVTTEDTATDEEAGREE